MKRRCLPRQADKRVCSQIKTNLSRQSLQFCSNLTCLNAVIDLAPAEIASLDKYTAVYRSIADILVYVIGLAEENELILLTVLNVATEALSTLLRDRVDKRSVVDNIDYVFLTFDELVDDGIILETDAKNIVSRVALKTADQESSLADQTFTDAVQSLREQAVSFISGR